VSKLHPRSITALTADSYLVFVAAGKQIYAWRRGNDLQRVYSGHGSDVHILFPFCPKLISVDKESLLKVWDIKDGSEYLEMIFNPETKVTTLCHTSIYMDKIMVGSKQGHMQLWNINGSTWSAWNKLLP
jgi:U3 small nucleolar RNA-associated protein 21